MQFLEIRILKVFPASDKERARQMDIGSGCVCIEGQTVRAEMVRSCETSGNVQKEVQFVGTENGEGQRGYVWMW